MQQKTWIQALDKERQNKQRYTWKESDIEPYTSWCDKVSAKHCKPIHDGECRHIDSKHGKIAVPCWSRNGRLNGECWNWCKNRFGSHFSNPRDLMFGTYRKW